MELLFYIFIFIIGTFIGSFLGVIIDRLPRGESIARGRSHCDHCKKSLAPLDLIPVFSFFFLRGRCRYCGKKLSLFYPIIEVITGVLFVLAALDTGILYQVSRIWYQGEFFYYLFIISILIAIFFIDLKNGIIPFVLVLCGIFAAFLYLILNTQYLILGNTVAGLGAFVFFLLLFLGTRGRGMGFGDVVYVFLMGLLLGFPGIVFGLYIAFVSGAVVSLILIGIKKKKMHGGTIAFGPFLVFGTLLCLFWGKEIAEFVLYFLLS